jgi:error-prone DNA polymerase
MSDLPAYAELHCRSNFSFLTGASHPAELVERAHALGYAALAITDECSLSGVVRAHVAARETGLPLIIGAEMRLTLPPPAGAPRHAAPVPHARLVVLAQTRRGYGNLSHWITVARRRAPKGEYQAHPGDLEGLVPNAATLAGLPDCLVLLVPDADQPHDEVLAHAVWLEQWFQDRAAIALELLRRPGDAALRAVVRRVATFTGLPIVAAGDVLMHLRSRKPLQDAVTATRLGAPIAACGLRLQPNAEQHLRSRGRLAALYEPAWLQNSVAWAARCRFSLDELSYEYPQEIVPPGATPSSHLRALTYAGAPKRFPGGLPEHYRLQIEEELALIKQCDFERFFLTVADIVHWARGEKILCQGRGSAANSLVCYCLGITEVDPRRASMLFGRFISIERNEPPDIDVDFEHERREEVIQYIYGKYGRHRAALTAVVIRYRPRSALRDMGRALGIDLQRIEAVAKGHKWFDGRSIATDRLRENGFDPESPIVQRWMELTAQVIEFPRHLSQHPGGFVISKGLLSQLVPVEQAAMPDRSVIQWEKDDLEELRLLKVDILALGMLTALRRTLGFLSEKAGRPLEVQDIADDDRETYEMICRADTVGVFQIESRAQMSMLPRLRPSCYYDLVVEVAIVRPGPIQGGMVHPYLKNRALKDEEIEYPRALEPALKRTKGVPIFQEQVMQIAMIAADFTPGEADALRRSMAAWKRRGGLGHYHQQLVGRMVDKGYDADFAERIFKQIEGFGEYGFPESHAAGFALLAYVSSWLKCHHPDAFLAALLNSQPMGFYAPAQLVRDARAHGVEVRPVDVTISGCESSLEAAPGTVATVTSEAGPLPLQRLPRHPVRLGLDRIAGLAAEAAERIVAARAQAPFLDAEDLARRASLNAHDLQCLAQADALRTLSGHRHEAAWSVAGIDTRPTALLRDSRLQEAALRLPAPAESEETLADYRALGLTLNRHPVALLRETLARFRVQPAVVLREYPNGRLARASGLVTHRQRPETAKGTMFVTIEDDTGTVNAIVWPSVVESQRQPLLAARLLTLYGRWQRQEGPEGDRDGAVMHLVVMKAIDHSELLQGLATRSRDFH